MSLLYTWLPKIIRCIRNGVWQIYFFVVLDHFSPFTPQTTLKNKIWKNIKNTWRYHSFINVHQKWRSYDKWFLRYKAQCIEFFLSFWAFCCPLIFLTTQKIKISKKGKKENKAWRYYHFTLVYYKHLSYNAWLLSYRAQHNLLSSF